MKKIIIPIMATMIVSVILIFLITTLSKKETKVSVTDWGKYDTLIEEIKTTTDFEKRVSLMHKAEDMLMATYAIIPIYYYNDYYMAKKDVKGIYVGKDSMRDFSYVTNGDKTSIKISMDGELDNLDPVVNPTRQSAFSFAGLYKDSAKGIVPNLAEKYELSDDGLIYTFTLKEGLKWSDGTKMDAKDFEYSWKRVAQESTGAVYSYLYDIFAGYKEFKESKDVSKLQINASDDGKRLTVKLNSPCAYFLSLISTSTFSAVNKNEIESAKGYKNNGGEIINPAAWATESNFVASGPFVLTSWKHNESMVYKKNPYFWDSKNIKIEKIEVMLSEDTATIYAAYKKGDLDYTSNVPVEEIANLIKNSKEFHVEESLGTYFVNFNVQSDLFDGYSEQDSINFRKAISKLIDRQFIADTVINTGVEPANTFVSRGMSDGNNKIFTDESQNYKYPVDNGYYKLDVDTKGAIKLLKELGFKFENGKLSKKTPLTFEYLTSSGSRDEGVANCIKNDLAKIGIDMQIKVLDNNTFRSERSARNFTIARNGWIADFNDPINMLEMWVSTSRNNTSGFGK